MNTAMTTRILFPLLAAASLAAAPSHAQPYAYASRTLLISATEARHFGPEGERSVIPAGMVSAATTGLRLESGYASLDAMLTAAVERIRRASPDFVFDLAARGTSKQRARVDGDAAWQRICEGQSDEQRIAALLDDLLGARAEPDGLRFAPALPARPTLHLSIRDVPYGEARLDIQLYGHGRELTSLRLNGELVAGQIVPATVNGKHEVGLVLGDPQRPAPPVGDEVVNVVTYDWTTDGVRLANPVWSPDGEMLLCAATHGSTHSIARLRHSDQQAATMEMIWSSTQQLACPAPTLDGRLYYLRPGLVLSPWEAPDAGAPLSAQLDLDGPPRRLAVAANGTVLALVDAEGKLRVAHRGTWHWRRAAVLPAPEGLHDVALNETGDVLWALHGRPRRLSWARRDGESWSPFVEDKRLRAALVQQATCLAVAPDERRLALGDGERIWVVESARSPFRMSQAAPETPILEQAVSEAEALTPAVTINSVPWTDLLIDRADIAMTTATLPRDSANRLLHTSPRLDSDNTRLLSAFNAAKYHLKTHRATVGQSTTPLIHVELRAPARWALPASSLTAWALADCDSGAAMALIAHWLDCFDLRAGLPAAMEPDVWRWNTPAVDWLAPAVARVVERTGGKATAEALGARLGAYDTWIWQHADRNGNGLLDQDGAESALLNAAALFRLEALAQMTDEPDYRRRASQLANACSAVLRDVHSGWLVDRAVDGTIAPARAVDGLALAAALAPHDATGTRTALHRWMRRPEQAATIVPGAADIAADTTATIAAPAVWFLVQALERAGDAAGAADTARRWIAAVTDTNLTALDAHTGESLETTTDLVTAAVFMELCRYTLGMRVSHAEVSWTAHPPLQAVWMRWEEQCGTDLYQLEAVTEQRIAACRVNDATEWMLPFGARTTTNRQGTLLEGRP